MKLEQPVYCTPKKCQLRFSSFLSQSMHMTFTRRAKSSGMGCRSMSCARRAHDAVIIFHNTAVFLQMGHRWSKPDRLRKQCTWMAWPHGSSSGLWRLENMSSRHTGQLLRYLSVMQLWVSKVPAAMHMEHRSQWRKFSRPPTRQMPHRSQWKGLLLRAIQMLHLGQWYWANAMPQLVHLLVLKCACRRVAMRSLQLLP